MNKIKPILSMFLVLMIITGMLAACSDASGDKTSVDTTDSDDTDVTTAVETEAQLMPDLPTDLNYDGYEFNFLFWSISSYESTPRACRDIFAESLNGDAINDAVYMRNSKVEETYNVKINLIREDIGTMSSTITKNVAAMDQAYDVVYPRLYEAASLMTQGLFLNLHDLPYLDLTKPWWDQNAVESLSIANRLYLVATDININDKDATTAIAFNKQLALDYEIDGLYDSVRDGAWTLDYMRTVYTGIAGDIDGNGTMDTNDLYGFLGKNDVTVSLFNGGEGKIIDKDDDDLPYLAFNTERNVSLTQKIVAMMQDEDNFFNHQTAGIDDAAFTKMFEEGHGLFFWMRLDEVTSMRASDTDFGILPTPKYDEAQTNYWNSVSRHTTGLMSVPITSDPERTSVILEALAAESKYTLQPAYYEVSLIGKSTRDEESGEMLEIIMAGRMFDLGSIYAFGGFEDQYMGLGKIGARDVSSMYATLEKSTNAAITKFIDNYLAQ